MSRYIKQDDVFELVRTGVLVSNGNFESVCKAVGGLPTIDIVRCKECKNVTYKTIPVRSQDVFYGCGYSAIQHDGDFYCAYGERKDNE